MLNEITACLEKGFELGVRWTDENGVLNDAYESNRPENFAPAYWAVIGASYVSHLGYEITLAGGEARVTWDSQDENAVTLIGPESRHRETFDRIDEQYEELVEFAHCAQTGATPSVSGMDACNVAAYFEAIEESINTEQAVRFRSFDE